MAMRPRTTLPPTRPRAGRVYEDFKPMSEWKQEEESEVLLIHLPGFLKEQIKVSTESGRIIRGRGERLVAGNKWSRFQEDFQVPENCELEGIRARFEGGLLYITLPKKISTTQVGPLGKATIVQEAPDRQDATGKPGLQRTQEDIPPQASPEKTTTKPEPEPQKGQDDTTPKINTTQFGSLGKGKLVQEAPGPQDTTDKPGTSSQKTQEDINPPQPRPEKTRTKPEPQKGQEDTPPKITSTIGGDKQTAHGKSFEAPRPAQKVMNEPKSQTDGKGIIKSENFNKKSSTVEKTEDERDDYKMENYVQMMRRLARGMNEERELMVNMGAAALVIVALGAYVAYTFMSSGKAE